jgi:gamma-glutamyltranspeptidase/glutathione hydrolase
LVLVLLLTSVAGQEKRASAQREPQTAAGREAMVVCVSPPAAEVGVAILKRGGSAVDAAVAVALAMAVTWPEAGNIGGGGFMMVYPGPGREPTCIEYRETAPAAATETMFSLDESALSHKFVGVPGTLRGLELAHRRFGKLPWKELILPAVKLADEGFAIDQPLADSLNGVLRSQQTARFAELRRVFAPPDMAAAWRAGDRLVQKDLAATLHLIGDAGPDAFYKGRIAEQIVAEMSAGSGLITRDDLARYHAKERRPIHGTYRGCDIYGPPPPSSGGICLVEMLNILEDFDLRKHAISEKPRFCASPETAHLMIEAMRRAYLDRARHLGDADSVRIPDHLTSKDYAARLAREIDRSLATSSESLAKDIELAAAKGTGSPFRDELIAAAQSSTFVTKSTPDPVTSRFLKASFTEETTHFSIVDASGMAVANTYTLEQSFGSRVVVRGAGFLLNNQMGDFNRKPGHTDRAGRIGTKANLAAPGKRMLSSQTPTIVTRDGRLVLATGSPGGRTIINTVLCVLVNHLDFGLSPRDSIAAPRLHHQWLPDVVRFEGQDQARFKGLVAVLRERGHRLEEKAYEQGDAHSIFFDATKRELTGVADGRRGGAAKGW